LEQQVELFSITGSRGSVVSTSILIGELRRGEAFVYTATFGGGHFEAGCSAR
jgi:hypothetical protein